MLRRRNKAEIPLRAEQFFKLKSNWAGSCLRESQAANLPFVAVAFDSLYGRSFWLREQCDQAGIEYYADIPANQALYLEYSGP